MEGFLATSFEMSPMIDNLSASFQRVRRSRTRTGRSSNGSRVRSCHSSPTQSTQTSLGSFCRLELQHRPFHRCRSSLHIHQSSPPHRQPLTSLPHPWRQWTCPSGGNSKTARRRCYDRRGYRSTEPQRLFYQFSVLFRTTKCFSRDSNAVSHALVVIEINKVVQN